MATRRSSSRRRGKSSLKVRQSIRSEIRPVRGGKRKVKSRKQAVAISLGKARRKGAKVPRKSAGKR
jgi:hypothetical protein